jgi:hypothetical protein
METVQEAAELAQLRTVTAPHTRALGKLLPALYLVEDYVREVPSCQVAERAAMVTAPAAGPVVIGKRP